MTIVEATRQITGGVDTHLDVHVAAALYHVGGLLGVQSFAVGPTGYEELLAWLESFGEVGRVGVEAPAPMEPGSPASSLGTASPSSRSTGQTVLSDGGRGSPIPSTRPKPLGPHLMDGRRAVQSREIFDPTNLRTSLAGDLARKSTGGRSVLRPANRGAGLRESGSGDFAKQPAAGESAGSSTRHYGEGVSPLRPRRVKRWKDGRALRGGLSERF
jgi:hypothetical protein